jgi:hypothetical protein
MKYLVIQNGNIGMIRGGSADWEVVDFTDSIKSARELIREQALRYFDPDSLDGDFSEYCASYAIYEFKTAVKPMPSVNISLRLKNINKELID